MGSLVNIVATTDLVSRALSGLASALAVPVHIAALVLLGLFVLAFRRLVTEAWARLRAGRTRRPGRPGLDTVATEAMADQGTAVEVARETPGPLAERTVIDLAAA